MKNARMGWNISEEQKYKLEKIQRSNKQVEQDKESLERQNDS